MSRLSKESSFYSVASTTQEGQEGVENRTLRVTLLSSEWRSSMYGDVSTINRELAIQLAKHPSVQVSVYLPRCSEDDKKVAQTHNVKLIEAEELPGFDPIYWLSSVPNDHVMDCVVGHGVHLGRQIQLIKRQYPHCKWIQVVHTAPEELGMYKSISEGEQMRQTEIELCEKADQVVAVGPKVADAYKRHLRSAKKDQNVLNLTPGIFTEFLDVQQATEERETFCVLVIVSGESEDFNLKGYDLAAQAIAELRDKSYQLRFICAPTEIGDKMAERLLQHGISRNQLIVRRFNESREVLAKLFCEVDLAIMPSRTEDFGLTALEALCAGLPVLVSGNSGLGEALKKVPTGSTCVVDSEDSKDWAKEIKAVRQKDRDVRLAESKYLREKYLEKYSWQKPCGFLVKKMRDLVFGPGSPGSLPSSAEYSQLPSDVTSETHEGPYHTQSLSQNRPTSTEKKRPLPLHGAQPSKRFREGFTDHDPHADHGLATVINIIKAEYNRRSHLKPLILENTIQLLIEDVYTRLKIVRRRKRDFKKENNEVNMYDIYKNKDVTALVEGSPGIGKTTFCLKIAIDWANEKIPDEFAFPEFEIVLLLKCRDIDGDIMEAIDEQLLPEDMCKQFKNELMNHLKDFRYQEKVLIILDGLDELPRKSESHVDRLLHRKILPYCYVLVTTCQERGIVVRQKVDFDILLQIEGLTREDALEYIRKHFRYAGPEHLPTGERLIKEVQENNFLHGLLNNPLNLLLLCVVFEDYQGELPSVRTELYQIIVHCILRRYCAKHGLEAPNDDKALEKQFENSLLALGELAWECLLEGRHSFREEELARFESNNKDLAARKLGLVFKEANVKRMNPQHEYHFFHKTFQDYLAALYLAQKILEEQLNVFRDLKFVFFEDIVEKYQQVFLFVSGILGEDASVLFGQIGEVLKSKEWDWLKCSDQVATFFTESFSESRNAEQVAMTLCSYIPFPQSVEINDFEDSVDFLTVAIACKSFSQLQHPLHLTVTNTIILDDSQINEVVKFLASWPQITTLSFSIGFLSNPPLTDSFFATLSENLTLFPFTAKLLHSIRGEDGITLAASKASPTLSFKLRDEKNDAWPLFLASKLHPDKPLASVVLKIYESMSDTAVQALQNVFSNRSLSSLDLIIYGDMTDSHATAVGEGLAKKTILKSLTLIVYGKVSCSAAISLKTGFLENTSINSLKVKVFGELPDNWVTVVENVLVAKKSRMSIAVYPYVIGKVTDAEVACLCPFFEDNSLNVKLQSLTLNLWGKLSRDGAEALSKLLIESSTSRVTLNIHGTVTDAVADRFLRYLKLCKTLSCLTINIWGELTRNGNIALQELSCNKVYSFELNICGVTSDDRINKALSSTMDNSSSSASALETVKDTSKSELNFDLTNRGGMSGDGALVHWGRDLGETLAKNTLFTTVSLTLNDYSGMNVDWLHGLADGLAQSTSLTTLSVIINSYSDMSTDWAHGLGDSLANNTSLSTLILTFNSYSDMSGDLGLGLGYGLAQNTSLTTLSLTFNQYGDIREAWEHGLGVGLAENTSLTTLSLTVNSYSDICRDWTRDLGDGLADNASLTTVCVTVNSYSDIYEDWAHGLGDGLAQNMSITTLSLTFNSYSGEGVDWGHGLGDGLAKNKSLTTLSLFYNIYSGTSGDWLNKLCDSLAKSDTKANLSFTITGQNSRLCGSDLSTNLADSEPSAWQHSPVQTQSSTKQERHLKVVTGTREEPEVKIDLPPVVVVTKMSDVEVDNRIKTRHNDDSEECEINENGAVWKLLEIYPAAHIIFPQNAVPEAVLFRCTRKEPTIHSPPLKKDEVLVSNVIELSYNELPGSSFNGDFDKKVSVVITHSATDLKGYEVVIKELVDSDNNEWMDLETTNILQASEIEGDLLSKPTTPFAVAKVTCCSTFAVVCRLKSYTFSVHSVNNQDFSCVVQEYPDVSVTIPASTVHANEEFQLTLKVQEIPWQWFSDSAVIVGPVVHVICSPVIDLLEPATITIPISLREDKNDFAEFPSSDVRVLANSDEVSSDWEEITNHLPRPADLTNGVVTFQMTQFSWFSVVLQNLLALLRTHEESRAFRVTEHIPRECRFLACLCDIKSPHGYFQLRLFCYPSHMESQVRISLCSTSEVFLYGSGNSLEPLCTGDLIDVELLKGIEADEDTEEDELKLRFIGNEIFQRDVIVGYPGHRPAKVKFIRSLGDQQTRNLFVCNIVQRGPPTHVERQRVEVKTGSPTPEELERLSLELGDDWIPLLRKLVPGDTSDAKFNKFDTENRRLEEKAYQMLLYWKQKNGARATYERLYQALSQNREDLADKYCL